MRFNQLVKKDAIPSKTQYFGDHYLPQYNEQQKVIERNKKITNLLNEIYYTKPKLI